MAKKTAQPKDPAAPRPRRRSPSRPPNGPVDAGPTREQIAEAAYHRYLQRGGQHGSDFEDWLEAERSLKRR